MAGDQTHGSRKSMRAIPLTQRQRKQGATSLRAQSASPQRSGGRRTRAPGAAPTSSAPLATPQASPDSRPSAPLDLNAESDAPIALVAASPAVDMLDTTRLSAPPEAEAPSMVMTSPTKAAGATPDDAPSRSTKVRVRRKRPTIPLSEALSVEFEETTILPTLRHAPPFTSSSGGLNSVTILRLADAASDTPASPVEAGALTTGAAPLADDAPTLEAPPMADALVMDEAAAADGALAAGAAPLVEAPSGEGGASTPDSPAQPEAPEAPEARQSVTTRKLPTLAIMAALATKAEARAEAQADAESDALAESAMVAEQAELDAPVAPAADAPGAETLADDAPAAPEASQEPPISSSANDSDSATRDDAQPPAEMAQTADAPGAAPVQEPSGAFASVTRPGVRGARSGPASQPGARTPPPSDETSSSVQRRMWWLNAPSAGKDAAAAQDEPEELEEMGAPDGWAAWKRPGIPASAWAASAAVTQPRPGPAATPRQPDRWPNRWAEPPRAAPRPRPQRALAGHAGAAEVERDMTLVWAGGIQAALCGTAALVAAIALLNGSAGERATSVFAWAMALALIAAAGSGLGHLAWQMKRAHQATLALVISQLGLLVWALALLGPRPALMTLAPIPVALALRGAGRRSAALTALAAIALYLIRLILTLTDAWPPAAPGADLAAALDATLIVAGLALTAVALASLFAAGERARARTRAIERAARMATSDLSALRARTEDDANALRQALANALRGVATEGVWAEGALSPLADQVNVVAERLVELSYDRTERKRLESATRRLIRNIERAWLGLSWSWPEASGVILDDLIALLRAAPPSEPSHLPEDTIPTGQVVAPHLYRAWQPGESIPSQPLTPQPSLWPDRVTPSQPSGVWPSLWPSDPGPAQPGADPFALPPSPRWRSPDDEVRAAGNAPGLNGSNGANGSWPPGMPYPNGW